MISYEEGIDAYHENPALSNSKINVFRQDGPTAFQRQFVTHTMERPDSDAFRFGRIFDDLVFLDESIFWQKYIVRPAGLDGRTKEGKAWLASQGDLEALTQGEWSLLKDMMAAIQAQPLAKDALMGGRSQVTIRRELPGLGVSVQARPDYLKTLPTVTTLVDLKSTTDIVAFNKNCVEYGYHRQLALGQWLLAQEGIQTEALLIVVEKKIAGRCRVLRVPEPILAAGWELVKRDIGLIAARYKSGDWTDVQTAIEDVAVPQWADRQLMAEVAAL